MLIALVGPGLIGCGGREGSAELSLAFKADEVKRLALQTQMDVSLTIGDRQIPLSLGWDLNLELCVKGVDEQGVATIVAYVDALNLSRRGGPAGGRDQGVLRYFHQLLTTLARMLTEFPRTFTIDSRGRLTNPGEQREFFDLLFPLFPEFPQAPVATGQTFRSEGPFIVPVLGAQHITQEHRFDSIRTGGVCRIVSELTARQPEARQLHTLGADLHVLTFEQSGEAELDLAPYRGEVVGRELKLDFHVTLVPEGARELMTVPVKVYIHIGHSLRSLR
ncbi:MAG: hypothetical protein U1E76_25030 [Planctomycetota bacterium]